MQSTRYAHTEGYTEICCTDDGKRFLTCGEDGDVRIWQGFDDIDSVSVSIGEKCSSIAQKQNKFYVANELNEVKKYDLNSNDFEDLITTFTLPVTTMCINKSNTQLICGSADFEIRLIDLATLKYTTFTGHSAPILHICVDPLEKYFLSSSCDGNVLIWSIKNLNLVKTLSNMHEKSNDFSTSKTYAKISWHKDANLIAIPTNKEIQFYERELWQLKFKINISIDSSSTDFNASITQFSPDGKFILVCTSNNWVCIHSIITKSLMYKFEHTKKSLICSIAWSPIVENDKNEILFCDIKGQMGCLKANLNEEKSSSSGNDLSVDQLMSILNDDDDETSNDARNSKIRTPNKKRKRLASNDESSNDTVMKTSEDDESLEKLKEKALEEARREVELCVDEFSNDTESASFKKDVQIPVQQQPQRRLVYQQPFQSTSTPLNLNERFMCYNSTGSITQFNTETDKSIIIEFHNVSYHHTIHIHNNHDAYTMADFCKEAIVLASPGKYVQLDNDEVVYHSNDHSKITCILINPWDSSNKEWSLQMPKKESIQAICVSERLCACFTTNRFLRVFTLSGIQREIIAMSALSVITMSAFGNMIFVCYYKAYSYGIDEHLISFSFIHLTDNTNEYRIENGELSLTDKAKLAWIGFSDEGTPYYYDSNGILYTILSKSRSGNVIWTPICNLRMSLKHKSDNYWLVGVAERNHNVKAILCRSSTFPQTLIPKPTIQLIPFQLALCESNTEKTQFENDFQRNKIILNNSKTFTVNDNFDQDEIDELSEKWLKQMRESSMKMFAHACKTNKEQRAYEYAHLMDSLTLQLAIKYATRARHLQLAQQLNVLVERKAAFELVDEVDDEPIQPQVHHKHVNQNRNDDIEIIEESKNQSTTQQTTQLSSFTNDDNTQLTITDSMIATPSLPTANARFNPFKSKTTPNVTRVESQFNTASPSILTEIEDKLNKQQTKDKNVWKPTPTRKLTKNKVTTPSASNKLDSFFNGGSKTKTADSNENYGEAMDD